MSAASPTAALALRRALRDPDVILPFHGAPSGLSLAASATVGLLGACTFSAVMALALEGGSGEPGGPLGALDLALVPPLTAVLVFPPLYVLSSLFGRSPGLLRLAGVGLAGPTVAGAWLGASSPLLLLYALTGEINVAFGILALASLGLAVLAGARAALQNRLRAGPDSPGRVVVLGHYLFTLWTAAVLALTLS